MDFPKTVSGVNLLAGQFTDGNPAEGVPASLDPASWANAVTNEILNVMAAGGQTPDETKTNQLLLAIQNLLGSESIPNATESASGLMSASDKTKLDGLGGSATESAAGLMSAADKTKLDGVAAGAKTGTVTSVTVANANGVSATVSNQGTTPQLTISLGAITPSSITSTGAITCATFNATSSDRRLKRDVRKVDPRPLHRSVGFVSYVLKENGWHGLGSIAQVMQTSAPEHVGEFSWHGMTRLNVNYAGAAYEQAMWAGRELDRQALLIEKQAKIIAKLDARVAKLERAA